MLHSAYPDSAQGGNDAGLAGTSTSAAAGGPLKVGLFGQFDPMVRLHLSHHRLVEMTLPGGASLQPLVRGLDGIVIRSPFKLDDACAEEAASLRWIIRAGSGTDNISPQFHDRGVTIRTTPINAHAVAELVLALTLGLLRHVRVGHESLREGQWHKHLLVGRELRGKTVGLVGFGRIGRDVASLMQHFGTTLLAHDRSPDQAEKQAVALTTGTRMTDLDTLIARSDVLVLCLPASAQTRHLLDRDRFARMRREAVVVNVGRGALIDLDALVEALDQQRIAGAALDVFTAEPPGRLRLFDMPNVLCTPHLGAQTVETHRAVGQRVVDLFDELIGQPEIAA